jgi:hypothetical protein
LANNRRETAPAGHGYLAWRLGTAPAQSSYALKAKLGECRRGYNPGIIFWKEVKTEQAYQAVNAQNAR